MGYSYGKPWRPDEIEYLKAGYADKFTSTLDIARALGRTRNQVTGKANDLKLKKSTQEAEINKYLAENGLVEAWVKVK